MSFTVELYFIDKRGLERTVGAVLEPWVSVDAVAEHLGVTKDSVYRWIERRGLPGHRIGRLWKFKLSEIDGWVRAGDPVGPEPPARQQGED